MRIVGLSSGLLANMDTGLGCWVRTLDKAQDEDAGCGTLDRDPVVWTLRLDAQSAGRCEC